MAPGRMRQGCQPAEWMDGVTVTVSGKVCQPEDHMIMMDGAGWIRLNAHPTVTNPAARSHNTSAPPGSLSTMAPGHADHRLAWQPDGPRIVTVTMLLT